MAGKTEDGETNSPRAGGIENAGNNKLPEKEDLLVPEDPRAGPSSRVEETFLEAAAAGDGAGETNAAASTKTLGLEDMVSTNRAESCAVRSCRPQGT